MCLPKHVLGNHFPDKRSRTTARPVPRNRPSHRTTLYTIQNYPVMSSVKLTDRIKSRKEHELSRSQCPPSHVTVLAANQRRTPSNHHPPVAYESLRFECLSRVEIRRRNPRFDETVVFAAKIAAKLRSKTFQLPGEGPAATVLTSLIGEKVPHYEQCSSQAA